jgi:hypothetical protein
MGFIQNDLEWFGGEQIGHSGFSFFENRRAGKDWPF